MGDYGWVIGAGGLVLSILTVYGSWAVARYKGESAADAVKEAKAASERTAADLAAFKTEVAHDYASAKMVEQVEGRVVSAIDRLGDRLDNIVEIVLASSRPQPAPRASRARSTKA